ncbi:MAG: sugar phosphate isomerase/epimerase [Kiritimatiellaeota bacterium]|nr:sugar phosphate isomerase/epimerase [Kiritimatiellota bacterium]
MKEHQDIRIGTLAGRGAKTAEYIAEILPYGFESFQINFWGGLGEVNIKELAKKVKGVLGDSGAIISSLGMFGNPLDPAADSFANTVKGWEACIDNAHLFGTDLVCGFAGRMVGKPIDQSMGQFKKIFGKLAKRAADKGVRLGFENCDMGGTWHAGDWNIAQYPTAWEMMFNEVPMDNLGLEWEPCHQMVKLIDPMPQLRKWAPKIFHIHGKDCTVKWDVIREFGVTGPKTWAFHRTPGFGDSDWKAIISELRQQKWTGAIDIEGWHDPVYCGDLEMTGQVTGMKYLKECRGGAYVPPTQN